MNNTVKLIRTQFKDIKTGVEHFGYRLFDDYVAIYSFYTDGKIPSSDAQLLRDAASVMSDEVQDTMDVVTRKGIEIDGKFYFPSQVKKMLDKN